MIDSYSGNGRNKSDKRRKRAITYQNVKKYNNPIYWPITIMKVGLANNLNLFKPFIIMWSLKNVFMSRLPFVNQKCK